MMATFNKRTCRTMSNQIQTRPTDGEPDSGKPDSGFAFDEDIEFKGVKLGQRQPDAFQEIVCEGGCE